MGCGFAGRLWKTRCCCRGVGDGVPYRKAHAFREKYVCRNTSFGKRERKSSWKTQAESCARFCRARRPRRAAQQRPVFSKPPANPQPSFPSPSGGRWHPPIPREADDGRGRRRPLADGKTVAYSRVCGHFHGAVPPRSPSPAALVGDTLPRWGREWAADSPEDCGKHGAAAGRGKPLPYIVWLNLIKITTFCRERACPFRFAAAFCRVRLAPTWVLLSYRPNLFPSPLDNSCTS